jgi:DNA polymerase-3 subunit alpha
MKPKFIEQASAKGHSAKTLEKVWKDWEAFASYAFNKSHSTCYAWIAYQTAYLKAHYPAEYMASVLSNNMNDIAQITFFMSECKRMGIEVLGPDVNESLVKFRVNKQGAIRFGMAAMKGVGAKAVESLIKERDENGLFTSVFDVVKRVELRTVNKKTLESLTLGGGFDSFEGVHRAQYFAPQEKGGIFLEKIIKFGSRFQENKNSAQVSMFDMLEGDSEEDAEPPIPTCEEWSALEKMSQEKEVVGIYISGHPLDDFKLEIDNFARGNLAHATGDLQKIKGHELAIPVICTEVQDRMTKKGNPFGVLMVEDYYASHSFFVFGEDYVKLKPYFLPGQFLFIKGKATTKKWSKDEDDLEFKILNIELLSELREKKVTGITLSIETRDVNKDFIKSINEILKQHEGKCSFSVNVRDEKEGIVKLSSRSNKVDMNDEFLACLDNMPEISYKLN